MSTRSLPTWLVSSPHRRLPPDPGEQAPRPHGLHHARRVGDRLTACGLLAVEWPYFWDLSFGTDVDHCCGACLNAVGDRPF